MSDAAKKITATEAARNFSELLNRVRYRGETFDVLRGGEVVARLTSAATARRATVDDLLAALQGVRAPDAAFASDMERLQSEQASLPDDPWDS